ncbi:hypothetical protein SAMN02745132_04535 [Enterovibrio nigricans DSM 22720]|uniref:Lipoprotein n=1 Tax=Enterovibrio nigricans DSM 22720 TaxID=1121868 RepID=A0A1T4VZ72_9GAMM|nr:hypothetical protein SAMN02745132_04535 [Enterovibrio nigricans DSM 22720]
MKSSLLLCITSMILVGCVPTAQIYNEASIYYHKNGNYFESSLDENRVEDILFLVSTGALLLKSMELNLEATI